MARPRPASSEFEDLGERLVKFGKALKDQKTSVGELNQLAQACGITLRLRATFESEVRHEPHS